MEKHKFHDLAFAEQGDEENFGDTIERIYARVVDERDAARAELAAAVAERARYGDMMSEKLGQCEAERDAAHGYLDECFVNDVDEAEPVSLVERLATLVKERNAARAERDALRAAMQLVNDGLPLVFESGVIYNKVLATVKEALAVTWPASRICVRVPRQPAVRGDTW